METERFSRSFTGRPDFTSRAGALIALKTHKLCLPGLQMTVFGISLDFQRKILMIDFRRRTLVSVLCAPKFYTGERRRLPHRNTDLLTGSDGFVYRCCNPISSQLEDGACRSTARGQDVLCDIGFPNQSCSTNKKLQLRLVYVRLSLLNKECWKKGPIKNSTAELF